MKTTVDLDANLSVMADTTLTPQEKSDLKLTESNTIAGLYCAQCGRCREQCVAHLEIPTHMRSYMYAYGYHDLARAKGALDQVEMASLPCSDCGSCRVRCTMGFHVKERAMDIARLRTVPEDFLWV
jgi:L-lactate utilization protein LutB